MGLVGLRLLIRVIHADWVPPEWFMLSMICVLFFWGFSQRNEIQENLPEKDKKLADVLTSSSEGEEG